jgi:1-acyl-sn-glycerol-3-phosphate acyltransferase
MLNRVLSAFAWGQIFTIAIGGFFVQAPVWLVTFPFDRGRRAAGRLFRLEGVLGATVSPFWSFKVHGAYPKKLERPTVVVSNHESNADVFLISHLPWEMKWLAKEVVFKVPFLGWSMKLAGDVPVRRGDKNAGQQALARCGDWLDQGMPVFVFPEGTRSGTGVMGPFKDGAFRLAIEKGADVLPLAVAGTRRAFPRGSWQFNRARGLVAVGTPISTVGMSLEDVDRLKAETRAQIEALRATIRPLAGDETEPGFPVP